MKAMAARDAKNGFGHLIDIARAEPVIIHKHGRPVVVMVAVEEFERLQRLDDAAGNLQKATGTSPTRRARGAGEP